MSAFYRRYMVLGSVCIALAAIVFTELPQWFQLYAFIVLLITLITLAADIIHVLRLHQIGNEVALRAIWKKLGLSDGKEIAEEVNEYLEYATPDMKTDKMWTELRGRNW
jgi:hypothetical protein